MKANNNLPAVYIYFDTMGCAKNLVDSEYALARLAAAGFVRTEDPFCAQVVVVNTCGFINDAKQESINRLLELAALKQDGQCLVLAATGCLVQRYRRELPAEMPEIDLWLGTEEYDDLPRLLWQRLQQKMPPKEYKALARHWLQGEEFCPGASRLLLTPPYTAYLKIAEGCDNCCSFCAIPNIRGPLHSRPMADLLAEAKQLREDGVQELCLIAQDTTAYGRDFADGSVSLLPELLRQLDKLDFPLLRLLYVYPEGIDDQLLAAVQECRSLCHYLDIPLQHVSNGVLRRMNRLLDKRQIEELLARLRRCLPDVAVRTTFMVGFPGETEEEFAELLAFAEEAELDWAGVFRYSQEEDTPAAVMPDQVPEEVKQRRYNELTETLAAAAAARLAERVGQKLTVLLEQPSLDFPGFFEARSQYQAPEVDGLIYVLNNDGRLSERQIGRLLPVEIVEASGYDLIAAPLEK